MNKEIDPRRVIDEIYSPDNDPSVYAKTVYPNPVRQHCPGIRSNSFAIAGGAFGDEGKGRVLANLHDEITNSGRKEAVSIRWQGGNNTGHEVQLSPNKKICFHQIPAGVIFPQTTGIITRGMILHPEDAITEINQIKTTFGKMPGNLLIDSHTPLCLDTERALETIVTETGSTGMGIGPAYALQLLRNNLTVENLMDEKEWRNSLSNHYRWVEKTLAGHGIDLHAVSVCSLAEGKRPVGTEQEFIGRLAGTRGEFQKYVSNNIINFLRTKWPDPSIPFSAEGAQAVGLHRDWGISPDYTASETTFQGIFSATEGVIKPQDFAGKFGVIKAYISSVGKRRLPGGPLPQETASKMRDIFDERGRSTGRDRDIYSIHLPALKYFQEVGGYEWLIVTHLDWTTEEVKVVTGYKDKNGKPAPYRPYQSELNKLTPVIVDLPGWDGEVAGKAKTPRDLPENALKFLQFLSQTIAPVAYATDGPYEGQMVSWLDS